MAKKNTNKIISVTFVKEEEEVPDLSHYGKYTDTCSNWVIVRRDKDFYINLAQDENYELPNVGRECRFFKPNVSSETPGSSLVLYQKYGLQRYSRMEAYNAGDWCMLYCYAEAVVSINGTLQSHSTGGVGGMESDDEKHLASIRNEEMHELKTVLRSLGFSATAIAKAVKESV